VREDERDRFEQMLGSRFLYRARSFITELSSDVMSRERDIETYESFVVCLSQRDDFRYSLISIDPRVRDC